MTAISLLSLFHSMVYVIMHNNIQIEYYQLTYIGEVCANNFIDSNVALVR